MTTTEAIKVIKELVKADFGKTFEALKPAIKAQGVESIKIQKVSMYYKQDVTNTKGYRLFYNTNPNFKSGGRGGGVGWFAAVTTCWLRFGQLNWHSIKLD